MIGEYPFVQLDFRILHHSANCYREGLAAFVYPMNARARAFANKLCDASRIGVSTVTASDTLRPIQPLKVFAGFAGVGENWICQITHGLILD
jgi:hypothetical protein